MLSVRIYDLDTRKTTDTILPNDGTIELEKTDHDVAIVLKRR